MTNDRSSRPPPSEPDLPPFANGGALDGCERPGIAVITTTATELEVAPTDLPPLNEVVDMDALDSLFEWQSAESSWPIVEFPYAGHRVRIAPGRTVELLESEPIGRWAHVSPIAASSSRALLADVIEAVSEHSRREPERVRETVLELLDADALQALNQARANGIERVGASVRFSILGVDVLVRPDGTVSTGPASDRIQQAGGNVLIVGDVPDALVESASAGLAGGPQQRRLFAVLDRDVGAVTDHLPPTTAPSAHVINHERALRSAATVDPGPALSVTDVSGDLTDVRAVINETLATLGRDTPEEPSLYFSMRSLRPIVEARDVDGVRRFLEPICTSVSARGALGTYTLPVDRSTAPVAAIESAFDATLELRVNGTEPEQRWHLHGSDHTTSWRSLQDG